MKRVLAASGMLLAALAFGADALADDAHVYTSEDLDRMFGPPPAPASEPVDKSTPADWAWVESYLDRMYARIDADRQYELSRRAVDIAEQRTFTGYRGYGGYSSYAYGYYGYGGYASLGLRYPASVWHQNVSRAYQTRGAGSRPGPMKVRPGTPAGRGTR